MKKSRCFRKRIFKNRWTRQVQLICQNSVLQNKYHREEGGVIRLGPAAFYKSSMEILSG